MLHIFYEQKGEHTGFINMGFSLLKMKCEHEIYVQA